MTTKIKANGIYGDFEVVKRLDEDKDTFGCICIHCGARKVRTRKVLLAGPSCDSSECKQRLALEEKRQRRLEAAAELAATPDEKKRSIRDGLNELAQTLNEHHDLDEDESIASLFSEQVDNIQRLIEENSLNSQVSGSAAFQLASLRTLVSLIPDAERAYRRDPRLGHSQTITNLMTQIRELLADMQAEEDRSQIYEHIEDNILRPAFRAVGQILIDELYNLRDQLMPLVDDKKVRSKIEDIITTRIKDATSSTQGVYRDSVTKLGEYCEE